MVNRIPGEEGCHSALVLRRGSSISDNLLVCRTPYTVPLFIVQSTGKWWVGGGGEAKNTESYKKHVDRHFCGGEVVEVVYFLLRLFPA